MKQRTRMLSFSALLSMIALVVMLAVPLGAHANAALSKGHFTKTKGTHSVTPFASTNLLYNGGPVMTGTTNVFAIFWEPSGSFVSSSYNSLLQRFFKDVHGTTYYTILQQYKDGSGNGPVTAQLAGTFVDTRSYPSNPIFDSDIQNEVSRAQSLNGWSSSIHNIFTVFTARGENECFDTSQSQCTFTTFCGYHSTFGTNTIYAYLPYTGTNLNACGVPQSPNNNFDADSTINVSSHELAEAVTDPLLNAWFDSSGSEIGDKCNFQFSSTNSAGGDTFLNGDPYEIQLEWDNLRTACRLNSP